MEINFKMLKEKKSCQNFICRKHISFPQLEKFELVAIRIMSVFLNDLQTTSQKASILTSVY